MRTDNTMEGPTDGALHFVFRIGRLSASISAEAVAAVYGSAVTRLKRYFAFATALRTHRGVHLTRLIAIRISSLRPAIPATGGAPFGLVGVALG